MKPSFIIIGGVKCASSSLYRYLISHPNVLPSRTKELFFFSNRGRLKALLTLPFYLRQFPKLNEPSVRSLWHELGQDGKIIDEEFRKKIENGKNYITGEATATYNFSADPRVVRFLFPKVRIIALVRNPTDRFISHYHMFMRFHAEGRKGYDLGELIPFIEREIEAFRNGQVTRILAQGLYYKHLSRWSEIFDRKQFFLMASNQLNDPKNAVKILEELTNFLDLPGYDFTRIVSQKFNVEVNREPPPSEAIRLLDEFYLPHNQMFYDYFGINLS